MNRVQPPKFACSFFRWYCRNELKETIQGDLEERFYEDLERKGTFSAKLNYCVNVLRFINKYTLRRNSRTTYTHSNNLAMIRNYLLIAVRQIIKDRAYSTINILGLAFGIAFTIVIGLFVKEEYSYDKFHVKSNRTFRLEMDYNSGSGWSHDIGTSAPMGPAMLSDFPEVESFVRFREGDSGGGDQQFVSYGEKSFYEEITYTDSTFFDVFDFGLESGNPFEALVNPNSVVISSQMAHKYFGDDDPLGKLLKLDQNRTLEVTGVLSPQLNNSHLHFDFLLPFSGFTPPGFANMDSWGWTTFYTYVLFKESIIPTEVSGKIPQLIDKYWRSELNDRLVLTLMPLEDVYLNTDSDAPGLGDSSSAIYSQILLIVGVIILVTSCFNYINLATARSLRRGKEVGIRKVLGALKTSIKFQFMGESMLVIFVSGLLALLLVGFSANLLKEQVGVDISINQANYLTYGICFFIFLMAIGTLSGLYPSFMLSRFKPIETLKSGGINVKSGNFMRSSLLTFQFFMAIVLIVATLIVNDQLEYLRSKNLGFEKEEILMFELRGESLIEAYPRLRNELIANPNVVDVGAARLGMEGSHGSYRVTSLEEDANPDGHQMAIYPVNYNFFETLGMNIVDGRSYSRDYHVNDTTFQFVINEEARDILGWENPIGKRIMLNGQGGMYGQIVGVVKNYHFKTLSEDIQPLVTFLRETASNYVYVKFGAGDLREITSSVEANWSSINPQFPFEYQFLDDRLNAIYQADSKFSFLITFFSAIAVFITGIGLLGMVAFIANQRVKEITIRKVLGASVGNILFLLLIGFLKLIAIAYIIAIPISYSGLTYWLDGYAYRIELGLGVFILAGILITVVAIMTIGYQSLKTALLNPVRFLRNE